MQEVSRERQFLDVVAARRLRPPRNGFVDATLRRLGAFFASAVLREQIAARNGFIQSLHPRTRLLVGLAVLVSVSLAASIAALWAHALLVAALVRLARIRVRELLGGGLLVAAVFSSLLALPATLNLVSGGRAILPLLHLEAPWEFGPYTVPAPIGVSAEGVRTAVTLLLRTLTSTAIVLCVALSTRWVDLLGVLRSLRVPALFVQVLGMTMRYLHLLLRQSEEVHLAKKSRTVCRRSLRADQLWVGSRVAATWERSFQLMTDVTHAMAARGFTGEIRFARGPAVPARDWGVVALACGLCTAAHLV